MKAFQIIIGWLLLTGFGLASGMYGLLWPDKYLRAWWTPKRGLKSAGTADAQAAVRFIAAVELAIGLLGVGLIIAAVIKA